MIESIEVLDRCGSSRGRFRGRVIPSTPLAARSRRSRAQHLAGAGQNSSAQEVQLWRTLSAEDLTSYADSSWPCCRWKFWTASKDLAPSALQG